MRNVKFGLIILLMFVSLVGTVSGIDSLGTYKQHNCITLKQVCATCTYINSSLTFPNSSIAFSETEMTDQGAGVWTSNFCNTSALGRYDLTGIGDINGNNGSFATWFEVTPSGFTGTLGFYFLILILSAGVIILGLAIKDAPITILGSFGLYFLGLYILFYGITGMKDTVTTYALSIIVLGLAFYISIRSTYELIAG